MGTTPTHGYDDGVSGTARYTTRVLRRRKDGLAVLLVAVVAVALYGPTLGHGFVDIDDPLYITTNAYVQFPTWHKLAACFAEVRVPATVGGYYQPLTMASLMLDRVIARGVAADPTAELSAFVFHLTNVLLHAVSAGLVFLLTRYVSRSRMAGVVCGLLFAVHPLNVEAVAWACQRKAVLSTALALCALASHGAFGRTRQARWYAITLLAYTFSLLAKPTALLLPLVLVLADVWPLRRISRRAVIEKLPLVLIGGLAAWVAVVSQGQTGSFAESTGRGSAWAALLILCQNVGFYLSRLIVPVRLCPMVPFPRPDEITLAAPDYLLGLIGTAAAVGFFFWAVRRRWTAAWVCMASFALLLAPALSPVRFMVTLVADRFVYLPMIAPLVLLAHGWRHRRAGRVAVAMVVLATFAGLTLRQQRVWRDGRSFYQSIIKHFPDKPRGYCGLGNLLLDEHERLAAAGGANTARGDALLREARSHYERSVGLDPSFGQAHLRIAQILLLQGRPRAAIERLGRAPNAMSDHRAHYVRGQALERLGNIARAAEEYDVCLRLEPAWVDPRRSLAALLLKSGRAAESVRHFEKLHTLIPDDADILQNWAVALLMIGRPESAVNKLLEAERRRTETLTRSGAGRRGIEKSKLADLRYTLAGALSTLGRTEASMLALKAALSEKPELLTAARTHPAFAKLRDTPAWRRLLAENDN